MSVDGTTPIAFGYDRDSLLTSAGGLTLSRNAQNGLLTGTGLGSVNDTRGYNGFGEVEDYSASHNTDALLNLRYTRDALGRITEKTETDSGVTTTEAYTYDLARRLTEMRRDDVLISRNGYDEDGNLTQANGVELARYDAQVRLLDYQGTTYNLSRYPER